MSAARPTSRPKTWVGPFVVQISHAEQCITADQPMPQANPRTLRKSKAEPEKAPSRIGKPQTFLLGIVLFLLGFGERLVSGPT